MAERKRYTEEQILKVLGEIAGGREHRERGEASRGQRPDDLRVTQALPGNGKERADDDAGPPG